MITEKDKEEAEIIYNLCVQIEAGLLVYDDLPKMVSRIHADVASQATKEARELIKEMREAISNLLEGKNKVFECSCEAQDVDELEVKTGKAFLLWEKLKIALEKSKEPTE